MFKASCPCLERRNMELRGKIMSEVKTISPMLAQTAEKPFNSPDWLFEEKLDGVRCLSFVDKSTKLLGRYENNLTQLFPEFKHLNLLVKGRAILDGEIVCDSFEGIQRRVHLQDPFKIRLASKTIPATYYIFDILQLDGKDLTKETLATRKYILSEVLEDDGVIRKMPYFLEKGIELFNRIKERGGEGIIAKRLKSTYQMGKRSWDWLKVKCFVEDEFYVCGLTKGENEREKTFGSLILGKKEEDRFVYMGCVGSGFTQEMLNSYLKVFEKIKGECVFQPMPKIDKEVLFWVKPEIKVLVRHLGLGSDALIRFPTFRQLVRKGGEYGRKED